MKLKILGLAFATGLSFAVTDARAMPLTHQLKAGVSDDVVAVRDGCGRGFRWSNGRQRCVPMRGGGVYVAPGYVAPRAYVAPGVSIGIAPPRHHRHYHRY